MQLLQGEYEVGVRELHDRLSEHLDRVADGQTAIVTRRGQPIARLSVVDENAKLRELAERGLVTPPKRPRSSRRAHIKASGAGLVSDLVAEQRI